MPKGVYIRKRKSARKPRELKPKNRGRATYVYKHKVGDGIDSKAKAKTETVKDKDTTNKGSKVKQTQNVKVNINPVQQPFQQPFQPFQPFQDQNQLFTGFRNILQEQLTSFGRNQNQVESIVKPIMSNIGIQATPFMSSEEVQATPFMSSESVQATPFMSDEGVQATPSVSSFGVGTDKPSVSSFGVGTDKPSVSSFGVGTDKPSVSSFGVGTESVGVAPTTFKQIEPLKVSTEGSGDTKTYERIRKEQLEKEAKEKEQLPITVQQLKPQQFTIGLADLLKAKSSLRPSGFIPMEERAAPAEEEETIEITPKRRGRPPKAKEPSQQAIQAEVVPAQKLGTSIATAIGKEITEKSNEGDFGIPVVRGTIKPTEVKPKRTRRTKTEIEEAKAQEELQKAAKQTKPITEFFKPK